MSQPNPFGHLVGGNPAPSRADPVIAPPDPYKESAESRAREDQEMDRMRLQIAQQQAALSQAANARANESNQRAEAKFDKEMRGEPIGDTVYKDTETDIATYTALNRALSSFNDDFGGNPLGGLENRAQSMLPVGTEGQREWWADFSQTDNLIRNKLFGSALSAQEKQAYEDTTISPSMRPDIIRKNLTRRAEIVRGALERRRDFLKANGAREDAVNVLFAPLAEQERGNQADEARPEPPRFREGDGNVAGRTRNFGDSNTSQELSDDGTVRQDNPALQGVRDEYIRRLGDGQSAREIILWARSAGVHPSAFRSIQQQVKFRDENPSVPLNQYDTTELDDEVVELSGFDRAVNSAAQSSLGSAVIGAANGLTAFTLDELVGATGGNTERARLAIDKVSERNPVATTLGTIAGGVGAALTAEKALAARALAPGLARTVASDAAFGAAAGAGASTEGNRLQGALAGAGAGAAGSYVGARAGNALARAASPSSNQSVRAMNDLGVPLTTGQQFSQSGRVGQIIKGAEDRIMDVPIAGEIVKQRRFEGYEKFNSKAFDRALEPIGGGVGGKTGAKAVEDAQEQVSQAFNRALEGKGAMPDERFGRDLTKAVEGIGKIKRLGDEVKDQVGEVFAPYADEAMLSGQALQDISRNLRDIKHAYRNDPLARPIHRQIDSVERAVFDLFDRQASGTVKGYHEARGAYRRLAVLEDAVLRAKNNDGVFTSGQLGMADRTNSKRFDGRRGAAAGKGVFHDMHSAAQDVLPSQVPNSGTAGRLLLPLAGATIIGADGADGSVDATSLTIGAILAGAYSKGGQRILTAPGRGTDSAVSRALAKEPVRRAISATGGAGGVASANALIAPR